MSNSNLAGAVEPEKTSSESAYKLIRRDILSGTLRPLEKLKVNTLRIRYGLGASPLREALSRLSSEGLVALEGQRGFCVADMSIEQAEDIGHMRNLLEVEALRLSIMNGGEDWEAGIVASFFKLQRIEELAISSTVSFDDWEQRNQLFHSALVSACNSPWLMKFRQQMYEQHERYRHLSQTASDGMRDVAAEHKQLMEATLNRDMNLATEVITSHIARTTQTVVRALKARAQD